MNFHIIFLYGPHIMYVFQVRLNQISYVHTVLTQGRGYTVYKFYQWVTSYSISYSEDCINFHFVTTVSGITTVSDHNVIFPLYVHYTRIWLVCIVIIFQFIKIKKIA